MTTATLLTPRPVEVVAFLFDEEADANPHSFVGHVVEMLGKDVVSDRLEIDGIDVDVWRGDEYTTLSPGNVLVWSPVGDLLEVYTADGVAELFEAV